MKSVSSVISCISFTQNVMLISESSFVYKIAHATNVEHLTIVLYITLLNIIKFFMETNHIYF